MCEHCAALEAQIEELEFVLRGAVWPRASEITALRLALRISPQMACILILLSKTNTGLSSFEIAPAVSEAENGAECVRVSLSRFYAKGYRSWIVAQRGRNSEITMSSIGRQNIQRILQRA